MGNFYTDTIRRDARFGSPDRVANPGLLWPPLREKIARIVAASAEAGVELVLFETFRSRARQARLFAEGRTKLRRVGVHHFGLAADLVRRVDGRLTWEADYRLLGELARKEDLVWGGDWPTFPDAVHVQAIPVAKQGLLFAGLYYPR